MLDNTSSIDKASPFIPSAPTSPDRLNSALQNLKDTVNIFKDVIGPTKLELLFSPETQIDSGDGWTTSKMVAEEGEQGEIILKRKLFLDDPNKDPSLEGLYNSLLPEYDSKAVLDADLFDVTCVSRMINGKLIIQVDTIGPSKYLLNKSYDERTRGFSTVNDPKFESAVGGGGMVVEQCFISPSDNKISRHLVAYIDLDPSTNVQVPLGINDTMEFDLRDTNKERHMRKVERKLDGSLVVSEGRLINQKQYIWDTTQVIESANPIINNIDNTQ